MPLYEIEVLLDDGAVEVFQILSASEWSAEEDAIQEAKERFLRPVEVCKDLHA
jgi:hypothetical protein